MGLARRAGQFILDKEVTGSLHCSRTERSGKLNRQPALEGRTSLMRNLNFGFFDDCGVQKDSRILIFYSFENDDRLTRSGIMHYPVAEGRFVGPRHYPELQSAALQFLSQAGRIPTQTQGA